ncbi:hypothetical protein [Streptomyces boncukensis]|uniref:Uncharacterized protein n=1 Tax=Streptomyces boncukensis TaxID=2711219 RepID=A0A6G4WUR4_9ACTN|nr:hypothetical protein [Streptomyces boncukensis]NGO68592.1 hypothetical protein [Streptomyces boncukensis]
MAPNSPAIHTLAELLQPNGPAALCVAAGTVAAVLAVLLPRVLWQTAQRMLFRRQARAIPLRFLREVRPGGSPAADAALCRALLENHRRTVEDHVRAGTLSRPGRRLLPVRAAALCAAVTAALAGAWGAAGLLCGAALVAAAVAVRVAAAYGEAAAALRGSLHQLDALPDGGDPARGAALRRAVLTADEDARAALAPADARARSSAGARARARRGRGAGR